MKIITNAMVSALFICAYINVHAQANQQLSNLKSPTTINQTLQPKTDNSIDLGSTTKRWKNIHLGNKLYLNGQPAFYVVGWNHNQWFNLYVGPGAGNDASRNVECTAVGIDAMKNAGEAHYNTAVGYSALLNDYDGGWNTAVGHNALASNDDADENVGVGMSALAANVGGEGNTAVGTLCLANNTSGGNTAVGDRAMETNTSGTENSAQGLYALNLNTSGNANTANGAYALENNTAGLNNTAIGAYALDSNRTGTRNTALGVSAGDFIKTGIRNTFIGYHTNSTIDAISNATALGNEALVSASNSVRVGNSTITSIGGYVGWTSISDGRIKKGITDNVPGLAFINKLKPITYHLDVEAADRIVHKPELGARAGKQLASEPKDDGAARKAMEAVVYSGFVAQDVAKAAQDINYDFSGVDAAKNGKDLYGLRYADFVVPLVKAVQELSKQNEALQKESTEKIAELQKEIEELKSATITMKTDKSDNTIAAKSNH